jgi:hypothetical protein
MPCRSLFRAAAAVLLASALLAACGGFSFEVKIPRSLVEQQVERKFPTVRNKGLLSLKLSNPKLDFQGARNRLGVEASAELRILGMVPIPGSIVCDGTLEYQPQNGTFVFTDVQVKKFNIRDVPKTYADDIGGLVGTAALGALGGLEIYKLDANATEEKLAKLALKAIRVTDDGIVAKLGLGESK